MSSGGAPTPAGISVFTKHSWDMGIWEFGIYGLMGGALHLWLTGLGIYDLS